MTGTGIVPPDDFARRRCPLYHYHTHHHYRRHRTLPKRCHEFGGLSTAEVDWSHFFAAGRNRIS